ncbi:MAG: mechanosensitive ion channel family protein [Bacteroidales bacterium]|jgi:small conductance mechanosensitive channel
MILLQKVANSVADSTAIASADQQMQSVAEMIKAGDFAGIGNAFALWGINFLHKLIIALVIFFLGRLIIKWIKKGLQKNENKIQKKGKNALANRFLNKLIIIGLYVVLILLIINVVGAKTVSIAAIIGSIGLAIGLAVKDNLANFAGGIMLLLNKPFKEGDYIEAQGKDGIVVDVGILYTKIKTFDNKMQYLPNGPLSTGNIINYNTYPTRRVSLTVPVEYGTDIEVVKKVLLDIAEQHPLVLKDPAPYARVSNLNDHSVDFSFRAWTNTENYWSVLADLTETVYNKLNENGIVIPFQQLTVHLDTEKEK